MSLENRRLRSKGGEFDPKCQVEGVGLAPNNHSFSQKTRIKLLSYGIKICAELSSVLSQSTRLTDRRTAFSWLHRDACIACRGMTNYPIGPDYQTCLQGVRE